MRERERERKRKRDREKENARERERERERRMGGRDFFLGAQKRKISHEEAPLLILSYSLSLSSPELSDTQAYEP